MSTKRDNFKLSDKKLMQLAISLAENQKYFTGTNPSDNSDIEDEVRKEVVSLCSSFPIYKNLRK